MELQNCSTAPEQEWATRNMLCVEDRSSLQKPAEYLLVPMAQWPVRLPGKVNKYFRIAEFTGTITHLFISDILPSASVIRIIEDNTRIDVADGISKKKKQFKVFRIFSRSGWYDFAITWIPKILKAIPEVPLRSLPCLNWCRWLPDAISALVSPSFMRREHARHLSEIIV